MCSPAKLAYSEVEFGNSRAIFTQAVSTNGTLSHPKTVWDWVVNKAKAADYIDSAFCLLMSDGLKTSSNRVSVKCLPS